MNKAYQLEASGWIPKSVLDNRGLKHPYYKIKNWWLETLIHKAFEGKLNQQEKLTILSLSKCKIGMIDLPLEIREYWIKYWKDAYNAIPPSKYDHYNDIGAMNDLTFGDIYDGY